MWEVATWQLPFENLNPYQVSGALGSVMSFAHPATFLLTHAMMDIFYRICFIRPLLPQIIALVKERGTDSLQMPASDQLAAGPFAAPGNYEAYSRLMRDCRWVHGGCGLRGCGCGPNQCNAKSAGTAILQQARNCHVC